MEAQLPSKWKGLTIKLYDGSTDLDVLEYMTLNERGGGELFNRDFWKLFQLEQNPLYETQSEIQLAKILSTKQQSTRKTIGCLYQQSNNNWI